VKTILVNLYVPNSKPEPLYEKLNCNVHFINKLSKKKSKLCIKYKKVATILWHYFHYKLFAILAHGNLYPSLDVHELGKTLIN